MGTPGIPPATPPQPDGFLAGLSALESRIGTIESLLGVVQPVVEGAVEAVAPSTKSLFDRLDAAEQFLASIASHFGGKIPPTPPAA